MEESGNLGLSGVIWDERSYVCIRGGPGHGASPGESRLERGLVGCFGAGREGGSSPALASLALPGPSPSCVPAEPPSSFMGEFWGLSRLHVGLACTWGHTCAHPSCRPSWGAPAVVCGLGLWLEHTDKTNNGVMNSVLGVAIWKLPSVFMYTLTYERNASNNKVINLE